ncbi:MAG TPA: transcription termination/antitermination protein NusG [Nitrospirales bacterium]|nr:transcription termination/antitermination protein NusG [Nitrospirales bacterium]
MPCSLGSLPLSSDVKKKSVSEKPKRWYVVHTYAGFEGQVRTSVLGQCKLQGMEDAIDEVLVPTHEVIEIKNGKKKASTRKFFPGYVLVHMAMTDEASQLVKATPKVTGFVGGGKVPLPLTDEEADTLLKQIDSGASVPRAQAEFSRGDTVRVIDGPFLGFNGLVDEVDVERSKVKILVSIFGRSTPVELNFLQVEPS